MMRRPASAIRDLDGAGETDGAGLDALPAWARLQIANLGRLIDRLVSGGAAAQRLAEHLRQRRRRLLGERAIESGADDLHRTDLAGAAGGGE